MQPSGGGAFTTMCVFCQHPIVFHPHQLLQQCGHCQQPVANPLHQSQQQQLAALHQQQQLQLQHSLQPSQTQPQLQLQSQLQQLQAQPQFQSAPLDPLQTPPRLVQCPSCQAVLNITGPQPNAQCPSCQTWLDVAASNTSSPYSTTRSSPLLSASTSPLSSTVASPTESSTSASTSPTSSSSSSSSKKKRRDPSAPKRSSNAYMIFCKEQRSVLKVEEPHLAFGRLGQRLGEMWRDMSNDEKQPYEERANVDRQRYKTQMTAYQSDQMRRQMIATQRATQPHLGLYQFDTGGGGGGDDPNKRPRLDAALMQWPSPLVLQQQQQMALMRAQQMQSLGSMGVGQPMGTMATQSMGVMGGQQSVSPAPHMRQGAFNLMDPATAALMSGASGLMAGAMPLNPASMAAPQVSPQPSFGGAQAFYQPAPLGAGVGMSGTFSFQTMMPQGVTMPSGPSALRQVGFQQPGALPGAGTVSQQ